MKDINYLFNETPLYTKEEFNIFILKDNMYELNTEEFNRFSSYIGLSQNKLISICHKCKKEFPFNIEKNLFELDIFEKKDLYTINITESKTVAFPGRVNYKTSGGIDITSGKIINVLPPYDKNILLNNRIYYIEYYFKCTNNPEHIYMMIISVELKDGKIIVRKIGQNPSMQTVKGFEFDKYEKFLSKIDAYYDYKKADLSFSEHFFAGAYTYLRRVFEKMINYYLGSTKLKDNHMDTKINAVKDEFDPRIKGLLKQLYEISSKSIHELSEEESKDYYEYLKAIIDMQLEYTKTENDKDKQSKELATVLSKITNLINNK